MKYIKTFERLTSVDVKIGDYVKEFIPGYGYVYYKILRINDDVFFKKAYGFGRLILRACH